MRHLGQAAVFARHTRGVSHHILPSDLAYNHVAVAETAATDEDPRRGLHFLHRIHYG